MGILNFSAGIFLYNRPAGMTDAEARAESAPNVFLVFCVAVLIFFTVTVILMTAAAAAKDIAAEQKKKRDAENKKEEKKGASSGNAAAARSQKTEKPAAVPVTASSGVSAGHGTEEPEYTEEELAEAQQSVYTQDEPGPAPVSAEESVQAPAAQAPAVQTETVQAPAAQQEQVTESQQKHFTVVTAADTAVPSGDGEEGNDEAEAYVMTQSDADFMKEVSNWSI